MSLILDGTSGLSDVDGTAAAPAIRGTDTNTGIFFPAADTIAFSEGGVEVARIDSSGNLLVGTTSRVAVGGINGANTFSAATSLEWVSVLQNTAASPFGLAIRHATDSDGTSNEFLYCAGNATIRMAVRSNGGIANYSANNINLSDRREKTNFAPAKSYLDVICAIPVQTYNYIDQNLEEDDGLTLGVVAQDVQAVAPELVTESNWGTEEDPKMRLSIYQTDLQYALMKCIQEQQTLITALTTRITALEGTAA